MKKRGNDNSQLRRDEVDALESEEGEQAGVFARAYAEELYKRKIIRSSRNFPASAPLPILTPAAAVSTSSNPFAAFGAGLLTGKVATPLPAQVTAAPVNPFQGFTGITGFGDKTEPKPDSGLLPYSTVRDGGILSSSSTAGTVAATAKGLGMPSSTISTTTTQDGHNNNNNNNIQSDEYTRKMKKLNNSIATWMDKQMAEQPLSIWKDGLAVS